MAQSRSPWPMLLFLSAIAAVVFGATSLDRRDHPRAVSSERLPVAEVTSICVTRQGLCQAPASRAGDPCSCPNLLRGMVPGHIERLGAPPVRSQSDDWASPEADDPIYDWEVLVAP